MLRISMTAMPSGASRARRPRHWNNTKRNDPRKIETLKLLPVKFEALLFDCVKTAADPHPFRLAFVWGVVLVIAATVLPGASYAQDLQAPRAISSIEPSVAQVVRAARDAARNDRNLESADLFGAAILRAPERRGELLQEYADQLTYSGRASEAVPLYREAIVGDAALSADQRLRLRQALGLALLWSDQPGQARAVYEDILRQQPADQGSRRNLARALSWGGRQREAVVVLQALLVQYPDDTEAKVQLSQAQAWMGRPDLAQRALAGMGANTREDARRLRSDLERAGAPRTRAESQRSTQSNQLDIVSQRLTHDISFNHGLGSVGAGFARLKFEREDGADSVRLSTPMIRGRYRFNDAAELNGEFGSSRIEPRAAEAMNRFVYSVWFTWRPSDIVRVDLSSNRATLDNLTSLRLGLTATQNGASVELTPSERQRYALRFDRGLYTDGNRKRSTQLEGEYRWLSHPNLWLGLRHTEIAFSELLDHGYFNPKTFRSELLTLRLAHRFGGDTGHWDVSAVAAAGREYANPGGSKPSYDVSLVTGWRIDQRTRLEARLQRFSSRTASSSGFERTTFGLNLERSW